MESDIGIRRSFVQCHFPPQDCKQGGDVCRAAVTASSPLTPGVRADREAWGPHWLTDPGDKIGEEMGEKVERKQGKAVSISL